MMLYHLWEIGLQGVKLLVIKMKREMNHIHKALKKLGFYIVEAYTVLYSHHYNFNCGCVRIYSVNPLTMQDSERLEPCGKHEHLV